MNNEHARLIFTMSIIATIAIVIVHCINVMSPPRCTIITVNGSEVAACR